MLNIIGSEVNIFYIVGLKAGGSENLPVELLEGGGGAGGVGGGVYKIFFDNNLTSPVPQLVFKKKPGTKDGDIEMHVFTKHQAFNYIMFIWYLSARLNY